MIDRRELLTLGGVLGALAPAGGPINDAEGVATAQITERQGQDIVRALQDLTGRIAQSQSFAAVAGVRDRQFEFFRGNSKFPDFVDVGSEVWIGLYDWHVRMQQPLTLSRDGNGRYTMMFAFTAIVLQKDALPNFIGIPYDAR
jgi:hypothetical protein